MGTQSNPQAQRAAEVRHVRDLALIAIGVSAPIGLLLVNGAAFVMNHLADFRLSIGIAAVVSSLALAGVTAQVVLGRVAGYVPELYARFHRWMIAAAVVSVIAWSLFAGWGAYQSMSDARALPNGLAVLTALWLLALPFAVNLVSQRLRRRPAAGPPANGGPETGRPANEGPAGP